MAKELLQAVSEFEQRISELLRKSEQIESADEHKKFTSAWATTVFELDKTYSTLLILCIGGIRN